MAAAPSATSRAMITFCRRDLSTVDSGKMPIRHVAESQAEKVGSARVRISDPIACVRHIHIFTRAGGVSYFSALPMRIAENPGVPAAGCGRPAFTHGLFGLTSRNFAPRRAARSGLCSRMERILHDGGGKQCVT